MCANKGRKTERENVNTDTKRAPPSSETIETNEANQSKPPSNRAKTNEKHGHIEGDRALSSHNHSTLTPARTLTHNRLKHLNHIWKFCGHTSCVPLRGRKGGLKLWLLPQTHHQTKRQKKMTITIMYYSRLGEARGKLLFTSNIRKISYF